MPKIVFIGAGRMATAIVVGMIKKGFDSSNITAFDIAPDQAEKFTLATGIAAQSSDLEHLIGSVNTVFLAVKPQFLSGAVGPIKALLQDKFIISIIAGVSIAKITELTGATHVVRVMPNTPALIGKGCAGYSASMESTAQEVKLAEDILLSVGSATLFEEKRLDAVTALSGSGPAYVFEFIDALVDGGMRCGLSHDSAMKLAIDTVLGATELLVETKLPPAVLCDQVTSPGGTTLAARQLLDSRHFKDIVAEAIVVADARAKELGKNA